MAVGQSDNSRVGCIIQARMNSTRLPGKVMFPIPSPSGKILIQWIVDQLTESSLSPEIIVATSNQPSDDILAEYCEKKNISCYRGSEENVLSRFIAVSRLYKLDNIVRLTGDNPLLDVASLDQTVQKHICEKNDYSTTEGLPLGMNIEVVSAEVLQDLESKEITAADQEHVTRFIVISDKYRKKKLRCEFNKNLENIRLTVDYPSDYAVLSIVLSYFEKGTRTGAKLVEYVLNHSPWVYEINQNIRQVNAIGEKESEIREASDLLLREGFFNAAKLLRKHEK